MSEITTEERDALVSALDRGGRTNVPESLPLWARARIDTPDGTIWELNTPGRLLAHAYKRIRELEKHAPPPSDLTRAQELLREWREAAIVVENIVASAELSWHVVDQSWTANLSWQNWKNEDSDPEQPFAVDPNPLAAVRAAIAQTPWSVVAVESAE